MPLATMILLAYYSLLLPAMTTVWAHCPGERWQEWKGHCYRLSNSPVSWHSIRGECKSPFRADVASITSEAEQDFIRNHILFKQSVWLGMRSHGQKLWWVDKSRVTFTNFIRGAFETDGSNDVVRLLGDSGKWEPVSSYAGIKLRGICKIPSCRCSWGWTKRGKSCYKAEKRWVSWLEAQRQCQRMAPMANLVTINSAAENEFVFKLVTKVREFGVWIGLNDRENDNEYRWIATPNMLSSYRNWRQPSEPNGQNHKEDCALMIHRGQWLDVSCKVTDFRSGFVCEQRMCGRYGAVPKESARGGKLRVWRPEDGVRCPDGWKRSGTKCFSRQTVPDTFSGVQRFCSEQHPQAAVAVVSSLEDNDQAFHRASRLPMWIASGGGFANWQRGDSATRETAKVAYRAGCLSMQESGQWLSEHCDSVRPGLCQVPACEPRCPAGWELFEGHCYRVNNERKKWEDAEAICQRDGGHLASILNQKENDFITSFAFPPTRAKSGDNTVFIGGSRAKKSSFWSWSDCSNWTISRWSTKDGNHPLFTTGTRAIIRVSGRWFGLHHTKHRFRSVCKLDPCRKHFGPLSRSGCRSAELIAPIPRPTPPTTFTPAAPSVQQNKLTKCPDGMIWTEENHICIAATFSPPVNFETAMKQCKSVTADEFQVTLPVVRFPDQESALMKLANGRDIWVGLNRGRRTGFWYWHDKTRMFGTKWQVKPTLQKRCASMDGKTGRLVARDCQDKLPFFCEARRLGYRQQHTFTSVKVTMLH